MRRPLHQDFLETPQQLQRHRGDRANVAAAAAMRTDFGRNLQHARANALTRHLQQTEMRDASDLNSGAILPQASTELALLSALVALLVHVDEVADDQGGEVAQAQLPRGFRGGFNVPRNR